MPPEISKPQKPSHFAQLLMQYMREVGPVPMSENRLAELTGMSRLNIRRWLEKQPKQGTASKVQQPKRENIEKVGVALGLSELKLNTLLKAAGYEVDDSILNALMPVVSTSITEPCQFFGRTELLRRFRKAWKQENALENIAVIGPRQSGKTSLLHYLSKIAYTPPSLLREDQPQGWQGWLPANFQFAEVSFQNSAMHDPHMFMREVLEQFQIEDDDIPQELDLRHFSTLLKKQQTPSVLLIDEIGKGLEAPTLDLQFWQNMRYLASDGPRGNFALVITAHESPEILADKQGKSSPFFGVFKSHYLKPFTEVEAQQFLAHYPHRYRFNPFSDEDISWLLDESGRWPALLQIMCEKRLNALDDKIDNDHWREEALRAIVRFREHLPVKKAEQSHLAQVKVQPFSVVGARNSSA